MTHTLLTSTYHVGEQAIRRRLWQLATAQPVVITRWSSRTWMACYQGENL